MPTVCWSRGRPATVSADPADGLVLAAKTGIGRREIDLGDATSARNLKVVIGCAPINAPFSVSFNGVKEFWGNCAPSYATVGGEFAVDGASRVVAVEVDAKMQWTVAVSTPVS